MAHNPIGRTRAGVHPHHESSIASLFEEFGVTAPFVVRNPVTVGMEKFGYVRVERPVAPGTMTIHRDDLRRSGGESTTDSGIYLLGSKTSMAGFVPPPGTYLTDYNYYYAGSASGTAAAGIALRNVGGTANVNANIEVDGKALIELPTVLWVSPQKVLGGNFGVGVIVPNGWKKVDVDLDVHIKLTLPPPINKTLDAGRHFAFTQ